MREAFTIRAGDLSWTAYATTCEASQETPQDRCSRCLEKTQTVARAEWNHIEFRYCEKCAKQ